MWRVSGLFVALPPGWEAGEDEDFLVLGHPRCGRVVFTKNANPAEISKIVERCPSPPYSGRELLPEGRR